MTHASPTIEGFRTAIRQPEIALAELTWRWTFGAAVVFLLLFSFFEYLDTVPVTLGDLLFLRSGQPFLVSQAIAHMFAGSAQRLVMTMLIVLPALAIFWIAAASAGRLATASRLIDHFRLETTLNSVLPTPPKPGIKSLFGLNFLRVALALATLIGFVAAAIFSGFVSSETDPRPGLTFLTFLFLATVVILLWIALNWFLSLAPLFVLQEREDTFGAISAAVDFCRTRLGPLAWSSIVFALIHFFAFVLATAAAFVPLMLIGTVPRGIVFFGILLVTLIYFAVVDFLYVGRLASYVAILVRPEPGPGSALTTPLPALGSASSSAMTSAGTAVDRDELILSDVPEQLASSASSPADEEILSDLSGLPPPPAGPSKS